MRLSPTVCYRAVRARDRRFDGRFFTAVTTTGIYCRPICPAPLPRPDNVRFLPTAAAAELAGFRACRRCRPELAAGTAAATPGGVIARALRLIDAGALDASSVEQLAARLGIGSRQLGRLFREHLGAPPVAVAQTRRAHFARRLLDETDLSMTRVAEAAGFQSVRRFNAAMRRAFSSTPTDLRQRTRHARERPSAGIELALDYRPPFAWDALLDFLGARATPGVERVADGVYRRVVAIDGASGFLAIAHDPPNHRLIARLEIEPLTALMRVTARVRRLADLGAVPDEIARHLGCDARLAPALRTSPGLRLPGAFDGFEIAVRAIVGQQVSVAGATTIAGRLAARYGATPPATRNGLERAFPTAERLAQLDPRRASMPRARAEAIRAMAREVASGALLLDPGADVATTKRELTRLPGIGRWTAEYVAMRALGDPDAFPSDDLVLRRAASNGTTPLTARELEAVAERWRPWRAYAALLLWRASAATPPAPTERRRRHAG